MTRLRPALSALVLAASLVGPAVSAQTAPPAAPASSAAPTPTPPAEKVPPPPAAPAASTPTPPAPPPPSAGKPGQKIKIREKPLLIPNTEDPVTVRTSRVRLAPMGDGGDPVKPDHEGDYDGVVPGRTPEPTASAKKHPHRRPSHNVVTWVGFQLANGSPRVFLQLSSPGTFTQNVVGNELVVNVPNFRLETRNDARALDTKYFHTDIDRVTAKQAHGGVEVHVQFDKQSGAARNAEAHIGDDNGYSYLYLDFGGGSSPAVTPTAAPKPAAPADPAEDSETAPMNGG